MSLFIKNFSPIIVTFLIFFATFLNLHSSAEASQIIFQDNFNNDLNGSFPSGWEVVPGSNCSAGWQTQNGQVGVQIQNQNSCATNITPNDALWGPLLRNYIFEADMKFVNGTDHNIAFRYVPAIDQVFELHFISPGDFSMGLPGGYVTNYSKPGSYSNGNTYHIKVVINSTSLLVYINNTLVRDITLAEELDPGKIALRVGTGSDPNAITYFDNVKVTSIDSTDLSVPLIKQTDSPWESNAYDNATTWSAPDPSTINRWGCAITSAAMVFQYYGLTKMPDGTDLNPGSINTWLSAQTDGYIPNGLTNWNALARLSKLAKQSGHNPNFNYDALEFQSGSANDTTQLTNDLTNSRPDILESSNSATSEHFIVATGSNGSTFDINDPYFSFTDLATGYNNSFKSIKRFIPANSDLSYVLVTANNGIHVSMTDQNGHAKGSESLQQPLVDDGNPAKTSGPPVDEFSLAKPDNGTYTLTLTSETNMSYNVKIYSYDVDGNVKITPEQGVVGPNTPNIFTINSDKNNLNNATITRKITFQSTLDDLALLLNLNQITKDSTEDFILKNLQAAQTDEVNNNPQAASKKLNQILDKLNKWKSITPAAQQILQTDITTLLTTL